MKSKVLNSLTPCSNEDVANAVKEMAEIMNKYNLSGFIGASNGTRTIGHNMYADWTCIQDVEGRLKVDNTEDDTQAKRDATDLKLKRTHTVVMGLKNPAETLVMMSDMVSNTLKEIGFEFEPEVVKH